MYKFIAIVSVLYVSLVKFLATPPQLRQHGFGGDNRVASANSIDYTASPSAPRFVKQN